MRPQWIRNAIVCFGAAAVLLAVYFAVLSKRPAAAQSGFQKKDAGDCVTLRRGDFEVLWRDEGELRPVRVTTLTFLRWGKVAWLIPEGTAVKKGDKIVSLETTDIENALRNIDQDLAAAEKNCAQQEQTRDLELKNLAADLQASRDRVEVSRLREHELLARPSEIEKEETASMLEGARARVAAAETELASYMPLAEKGYASLAELEGKKTALELAKIELERAEMKAQLALSGARPEERVKARLEREKEELALRIKELDVTDKISGLKAAVVNAQREADHQRLKLETQKDLLEKSTILAPHEGIVVHRQTDKGKKCEVGEIAGPWRSPVELPSYEKMKVRTQVPESFIRHLSPRSAGAGDGHALSPGSPARVIIKTLPDRVYDAEVTWIDGWARDRNAKLSEADIKAQGLSGVSVFDVEAELADSDPQRLREGFRATVEFPMETLKNVIAIPVHAVTMRDDTAQVQVQDGSECRWRKVKLGIRSMDKVVVTRGLREGERIWVPRQRAAAGEPGRPEPKKNPAKTARRESNTALAKPGGQKEAREGAYP